jgi:predicted transcriptional regulator
MLERQLLSSLHQLHYNEVQHIIHNVSPLPSLRQVIIALKQYKLEKEQFKETSQPSKSTTNKMSNLNLVNNATATTPPNKPRFTEKLCLEGNHNPAKCFAKLENAAAKKAFFDKIKKDCSQPLANNTTEPTESSTPTKNDANRKPSPSANNTQVKKKLWVFILYNL